MIHNKKISPQDASITPGSLPDRSKLSKLYAEPKKSTYRPPTDAELTVPINTFIVSLLLAIPVIVTYFSVMYIYSHGGPQDILYPLIRFGVSGICVVTWIVVINALIRRFYNYPVLFWPFFTVYLFYLFPLLKIGNDLGWGTSGIVIMALFVGVLFAVTYTTTLYTTWILTRPQLSDTRKAIIALLPDLVLIAIALVI